MRNTALSLAVATVAASLLPAVPAQAQNTRSFVSGSGLDTNACSLTAPCRTFAGAISKTNAGGEITVLDTAGYGPVTITKAISIINPGGVEAGIAVQSGGTGIFVNAGPNDAVILKGLIINGAGVGFTANSLFHRRRNVGRGELLDQRIPCNRELKRNSQRRHLFQPNGH